MLEENIKHSCVAIIPARGGSKGIPRKNLIDFCGKPLIVWSIEQALNCRYVGEVYVTTDDKEIAAVSLAHGAKAIERPVELATDTVASEEALLHAVSEIEKTRKVNLIVFLQPTSPIRESLDIDNAVEKLFSVRADSLFSASLLEDFCIWLDGPGGVSSFTYDYKDRGRRQSRKPLYLENGSIYVFRPRILKKDGNRLGGEIAVSVMENWKSFEIDSPKDIQVCEYFMNTNILRKVKEKKETA